MTTGSLPPGLARNSRLDRWVEIRTDGVVEVRTGKVEIGQGITSALAQIAAEELDVDYARIRMIPADTGRSPNEGVTAGSRSTMDGGGALRQACAEVRDAFLQAAARRLDAGVDELFVRDGTIHRKASNESATYWELSVEVDLSRDADGRAAPKRADQLTLVGKPLPRLDLPDKVAGAGVYVHDLELPGMLHGRVVRPPSYRAVLQAFDGKRIEAMPGVRAVVRDGRFLGVVAAREEQAVTAAAALAKCAVWQEAADLPDVDAMPAFLRSRPSKAKMLSEKGVPRHTGTHDLGAHAEGAHAVSASYSRPFLAHASIGPACAVARVQAGAIEVWCQSQSIHPTRLDIAKTLGVAPDTITVRHVQGAGCYGHNAADDAALDAVLLARAVEGHPVRLQWSHEDELAWSPFGPAMVVAMNGAVDGAGRIVDWRHELWSNPHIARPGLQESPSLLAAWHLDRPFAQPPGIDALPGIQPTSERNAVPIYDFPNQRVVLNALERLPVRTGTLRAIGGFLNTYAIECFMDELAHAAGVDPVELRLKHLGDERAIAVIEAARARSGLASRSRHDGSGGGSGGNGSRGDGTRGRGLGFARYSNEAAYAAVVVEVEAGATIKVVRAVAVVDCGRTINPDGVSNQVEGGIVQAVSWVLKEQVRFDRTRITTRTWDELSDPALQGRPQGDEPGSAADRPASDGCRRAADHPASRRDRERVLRRDRRTDPAGPDDARGRAGDAPGR
ncbi:MAG: molybdopterin-dependent oxidoreductase, partial [Rhodospirillales bacterium]|nr:molybdopterin-dependent oxidoreductase [Rhodospirillales bacterium]